MMLYALPICSRGQAMGAGHPLPISLLLGDCNIHTTVHEPLLDIYTDHMQHLKCSDVEEHLLLKFDETFGQSPYVISDFISDAEEMVAGF